MKIMQLIDFDLEIFFANSPSCSQVSQKTVLTKLGAVVFMQLLAGEPNSSKPHDLEMTNLSLTAK
jgi:hypothetical protein